MKNVDENIKKTTKNVDRFVILWYFINKNIANRRIKMSNKEKINDLREKLNESIENNEDYSIIYELSIQLDELISNYYKENYEKNVIF